MTSGIIVGCLPLRSLNGVYKVSQTVVYLAGKANTYRSRVPAGAYGDARCMVFGLDVHRLRRAAFSALTQMIHSFSSLSCRSVVGGQACVGHSCLRVSGASRCFILAYVH